MADNDKIWLMLYYPVNVNIIQIIRNVYMYVQLQYIF